MNQNRKNLDLMDLFKEWRHDTAISFAIVAGLMIFVALGFNPNYNTGAVITLAFFAGLLVYFIVRAISMIYLKPNVDHLVIRSIREEHHYIETEPVSYGEVEEREAAGEIEYSHTNEVITNEEAYHGAAALVKDAALPEHIESTKWRSLSNYLENETDPAFSRRSLLAFVNHWFYVQRDGKDYITFPRLMRRIGAATLRDGSYNWKMPQAVTIMKDLADAFQPAPPPRVNMVHNEPVPAGTGAVQGGTGVVHPPNGAGEAALIPLDDAEEGGGLFDTPFGFGDEEVIQ